MATATRTRTWTYADLEAMPESTNGDRYEIIDGELIVTPSAVPFHQLVQIRLSFQFDQAALIDNAGVVLNAPVDIVFAPKQVAIPDLVFVRRERLHIIGAKAIEAAPDIVVEVLSPSTRRRDLGAKQRLYAAFGVPEYWIADPKHHTLAVLVLRDGRYEPLPQTDGVAHSTVLPDLAVDVAALFTPIGA